MATYKEIQSYVHEHYGYIPETCWIAHVKEIIGIPVKRAHNRQGDIRVKPCPPQKQDHIKNAFEYFGMIEFTESEIRNIKNSEKELPQLDSYSIYEIDELLFNKKQIRILPSKRILRVDFSIEYIKESDEIALSEEPPVILYEKDSCFEIKEWFFAMTSEFRKTVSRLDKKLQGRILSAITQICQSPMESLGDTIKPLSGSLNGKWRYRIGDFRIIYQPDINKRVVFLLAVFPRGSAYE